MADRKGKGKMSSELIEQKLILFNSSQESVQAMSLWIMHNKAHHQKIVDSWIKVLRKSDSKHKLTLFYLCNDVVQHAKKKKALYYLENFKDNLREAVQIVREFESIKPNIERIFKIWEERRTYDAKFIKELRSIMEGGSSSKSSSASGTPAQVSPVVYKPSSKELREKHKKEKANKDSDKIIAKPVEETPDISGEFKPPTFLDQMTSLKKLEGEVTLKAKQLAALRIDATNIEAVKQLKDRSHGNEFCRQFEESCVKIEDYVAMLEKEIRQRQVVLSMCDNAEDFYCTQFDEAKVVANAYKNFGARVTNMKKRVDDMKKIIPSTPSPVPSPTADAPSPGNTPPLLNMDDNETIDMEICNEDSEQAKSQDQTSKAAPGAPNKDMLGGTFQGTNILESRIATMLPNLAKGNSSMPGMAPAGIGGEPPDLFTTEKPATQVPDVYTPPPRLDQLPPQPVPPVQPVEPVGDDAGSSTPVQDEQEEKELTPPPKSTPAPKPETKTKTNPIDFLSQLLTKTSSSSSSSNFLQTLSLLTNTVKTQYQKKQSEEADVPNPEEDPKPPSPTFSGGITGPVKSAPAEFTGVPPPVPSTQASSWSGWKQVSASQPDPSSPPVISQPKTPDVTHQPPLPQHAPPPPESLPSRPFNMQPPSPQDFSLPPPTMRQSVSQSFINPPPPVPPPPSNSQQFMTQVSSAAFPQVSSSQPVVITATVAPTNLVTPQPGLPFSSNVPFGVPPPASNSGPALVPSRAPPPPSQPLNTAPGFPQPLPQQTILSTGYPQPPNRQPPPVSGYPPPPVQPGATGPGFIQGRENAWEPQRPVVSEPVRPNIQAPFIRGPFAPPPPPPDTTAPLPWQPENARAQNQQSESYGNQISSVPSQRSEWENPGNAGYDDPNWEGNIGGTENRSGGYAHPWDQPQNYDEDDDDAEFADEILETTLPPAPKKSILRNNRKSSLREVTLVEETSSSTSSAGQTNPFVPSFETSHNLTPVIPQAREHKPVGILKKSSTEAIPVTNHGDRTQSEFINILKQKSGANANLPNEPPSSRTLTTLTTVSSAESHPSGLGSENVSANHTKGEPISTIGVVGNTGRPSSVQSDDMDLDTEDQEYGNNGNVDTWQQPKNEWDVSQAVNEKQQDMEIHKDFERHHDYEQQTDYERHEDFEKHKGFERRQDFERHQNFERHPDFERRDYNGPPPRPRWPEQRPWQHRPQEHDQGGFRPRGGFPPRTRFYDNFRGPSPAKRPFFSPRQRMPYHRF
ncbi:regulation of nuclear pre-mRNA domain-containing protein 2-like isoform X2 [Mercenaria mercenaria]|uniref:regulation of nuclear pre-mRNA domain-containing protein 2-like isoform X2 n=1 Tax=Mercenaria mercenaria TaxID=6596 RepID=UPI00234F34F8|nr:regulation of nuclear pre-mRNA domain-containing protein 2-like isoform X2 [Mercenaria mercenaria]